MCVCVCVPPAQDGLPSDEQSKSMLYAALKLRLSLVGSMLASICATESTTLEWMPLLMQLICSGAVDRQTDSRWGGGWRVLRKVWGCGGAGLVCVSCAVQ